MKLIAVVGFIFGLLSYLLQLLVFIPVAVGVIVAAVQLGGGMLTLLAPAVITFVQTSFYPMAIMLLATVVLRIKK